MDGARKARTEVMCCFVNLKRLGGQLGWERVAALKGVADAGGWSRPRGQESFCGVGLRQRRDGKRAEKAGWHTSSGLVEVRERQTAVCTSRVF